MRPQEQQLVELERQFWQAMKDRDVDAALRLTADECIITGPQGVGVLQKEQLGKMMVEATYDLDEFTLNDDVEVRMLGDDVAVLAYTVHEKMTIDGKPVTLDAADSSTWVRRDGRWVCVLHTEALTGDPFGRDRNGNAKANAGNGAKRPVS
ncbi:MAG: nuclear transport factor 2 family protein [Kofleriaceae bacterium]